jgi:cation diffusion facilitator family transporter
MLRMPPAGDRDVRIGRAVALTGIAASALLAALNISVGLYVESSSVFATGVEFAGDVLASVVVLLGLIVAGKPADDNHPYGHGRIESLAAFVVGLILVAGGIGVCANALRAVGEHHPPPSSLAVVVLSIAVVVRGVMSALKFRVGRRIGSGSLVADAWNDAIDILGALVALVAVWLTGRGERFLAADHYGGFAVGVIVVVTGVRVIRDATLELVDTMPDADRVAQLRGVAASVPGVAGVDKAFARKTGFTWHVDIHVEVDPAMTVAASHEIAGAVRRRVRSEVSWVADVLVHVEPAGG